MFTLNARVAGLLFALHAVGCPSTRDNGGSGSPQGTASAVPTTAAPALHPSTGVLASAIPQPEADRVVPLLAGEALSKDPAAPDLEALGAELLFEVRPRDVPNAPLHLGAIPAAVLAGQTAAVGVLRAATAAGRVRLRAGAHAFALEEGWELRADRRRGGAILLIGNGLYRVVPSGALRTVLAERRVDVMPLGPTHLAALDPGSHLGRATTRTRITTSYGTLDLDQMTATIAAKPTPVAKSDARSETIESQPLTNEPGGEALCRMFLELVAADRALGGAPCETALIPVRADLSFAVGGGVTITATSIREGPIARVEVGFPPPNTSLSTNALPDPRLVTLSSESLLSLRAKGEPVAVELSNRTPSPRWLLVDGVSSALVPANTDATMSLRGSRYVFEWRTLLGEILERATEIDAPGRVAVVQWVPPPLSSASPIASARNGP